MRAFIATVDLVIRADSHANAQKRLHLLLTDQGVHADHDPVLLDWSYVSAQRWPQGAWPKEVSIWNDWHDLPEGMRDASRLFRDRDHTEPMLVLNTAHLSSEMRRLLHSMAPGVIEYDWGWIARVHARLPALAPIQTFALERGCLWIMFDQKAPVLNGLPVLTP